MKQCCVKCKTPLLKHGPNFGFGRRKTGLCENCYIKRIQDPERNIGKRIATIQKYLDIAPKKSIQYKKLKIRLKVFNDMKTIR